MNSSAVWLFLGSVLIACGALYQMWIESGAWRAQLLPTLGALDELAQEHKDLLAGSQDVRVWHFRRRWRITQEARRESFTALTDAEKAMLLRSDRAGWAWALVCTGALGTALGSGLAVF